ncbi:MAG: hypothetical protein QXD29_00820 [Thermoplasmata archaeon]
MADSSIEKLAVKIDIVCSDIRELKNFMREAVERIAVIEERVCDLERWRNEVKEDIRIRMKFIYNLISAMVGAVIGGFIAVIWRW